jgi:hypothetical protein
MLLETVRNPRVVLQQRGGRYLYLDEEAAVAIHGNGQVVTAYTRGQFNFRIQQILREASGGQ